MKWETKISSPLSYPMPTREEGSRGYIDKASWDQQVQAGIVQISAVIYWTLDSQERNKSPQKLATSTDNPVGGRHLPKLLVNPEWWLNNRRGRGRKARAMWKRLGGWGNLSSWEAPQRWKFGTASWSFLSGMTLLLLHYVCLIALFLPLQLDLHSSCLQPWWSRFFLELQQLGLGVGFLE